MSRELCSGQREQGSMVRPIGCWKVLQDSCGQSVDQGMVSILQEMVEKKKKNTTAFLPFRAKLQGQEVEAI